MIDKTVEQVSAGAMYGGTMGTAVAWGLQLPDLAAIVTAVVALIGGAVNIWFVFQKNRRAEEAHRAEMEERHGGPKADGRGST